MSRFGGRRYINRFRNKQENNVRVLLLALIILVGTPAFADFQKGYDAYRSEDYVTTLNEWVPLAEQGDAEENNS